MTLPDWVRQIKERAERATGGPWTTRIVEPFTPDHGGKVAIDSKAEKRQWMGLADVWLHCSGRLEGMRNAKFIAHSRQDIPKLIAEVERLTGENEGLGVVEREPRAMFGTVAFNKAGNLSRDKGDVCLVHGETPDCYVGSWAFGFGFVEVRFPKSTTRELTDDEIAFWRTKVIQHQNGLTQKWPAPIAAPAQEYE